jgi:gliding motility-associated-like protein
LNCNDVTAHLLNTSRDAAAYQWKFSDGSTSVQNDPDYHFNYNAPYSISLIAINNNTCSDTASVIKNSSIEDYLTFNISNVFTPNGDGINDEFQLNIDTEVSECFGLTIFDRWGNTMFKSSDGSNKWDGSTSSGAKAAAGTYFYVIDINNAQYKGFVSLSE